MTTGEMPEAWVGRQVVVNLVAQPGEDPAEYNARRANTKEGQLQSMGNWGITVLSTYSSEIPGEYQRTEFYPWTAVRSIWPAEEQ